MTIQLISTVDIRPYVFGGKAVFTLVSKKTGNRYTVRVRAKERVYFVEWLSGPDNTDHYTYAGYVKKANLDHFRPDRDCPRKIETVLTWFFERIHRAPEELTQLEFWTSGNCSRCGRVLTVPESIAIGMGPVCLAKTKQSLML